MRSSAAGSTFSEYYGVNGNIGRAIMIIASLATVLLGLNKLVQIIGYISPVLLLEQGYEVHITYRRSAGKAEELMAANPGRLFAHKLDQGKIEEIENADFLVENEWYGVIFNAALGSGTVKEYADQGDPLKAANDVALMTVNALGPLWIYKKMEPVLLAEPGDVFLIPAPYYSSFVDDINERAGVIAVGVPCDETLDRNAFEAAYERVTAEGRRVRAVLFSSPNNPIGIVYKEDAVRHVIDFAMAHDLEIISDEIYAQTVFDPEAHYVSTLKLVPAGCRHRVHVTSSFAKDFVLSGFRTGMCFSFNPAIIQGFGSITYYSCVSSHTQSLLRALLQSPELEGVMDLSRQRLKTAYEIMTKGLADIGVPTMKAQAGIFIMADFSAYMDKQEFAEEHVLWQKIYNDLMINVSPGQLFGCDRPGWFRMCYAFEEDTVKEACRRLATLKK